MTAAKRRQARYPWTTAEALRAFKTEHGLTERQLADVLKVSKSAIGRWLQKDRMPKHIVNQLATHAHQTTASLARVAPAAEPELFIFQGFVRSQADLATVTRIVEAIGGQIVGGMVVP